MTEKISFFSVLYTTSTTPCFQKQTPTKSVFALYFELTRVTSTFSLFFIPERAALVLAMTFCAMRFELRTCGGQDRLTVAFLVFAACHACTPEIMSLSYGFLPLEPNCSIVIPLLPGHICLAVPLDWRHPATSPHPHCCSWKHRTAFPFFLIYLGSLRSLLVMVVSMEAGEVKAADILKMGLPRMLNNRLRR